MPIVTANQIKRVGNRMEFRPHHFRHPVPYPIRMNGLGITTDQIGSSTMAGVCIAGAIAAPATLGTSLIPCIPAILKAFMAWLTGKQGQYKIDATQFAEGIVRLCYGLDPDCRLPTGGIPVVPGAKPPLFCASSVAGLIERCDLYNAQIVLAKCQQLMQQKLSYTNDPITPYVKRWYDQYGTATFSDLSSKLSQAQSVCGAAASQPGNPSQYPGGILPTSYPTATSYTPYLILGGIALFGVFMMNR